MRAPNATRTTCNSTDVLGALDTIASLHCHHGRPWSHLRIGRLSAARPTIPGFLPSSQRCIEPAACTSTALGTGVSSGATSTNASTKAQHNATAQVAVTAALDESSPPLSLRVRHEVLPGEGDVLREKLLEQSS